MLSSRSERGEGELLLPRLFLKESFYCPDSSYYQDGAAPKEQPLLSSLRNMAGRILQNDEKEWGDDDDEGS